MNILSRIGIVILVSLMTLNMSLAREGRGKRGGGHAKILKQLDLSEEQKEKIKEFREGSKAGHKEKRSKMKAVKEKMKEAFSSDASDAELTVIHNEIKSLESEKADARFKKLLQMRSVLTPEQRVKFQELKKEKREKRRGKHRND